MEDRRPLSVGGTSNTKVQKHLVKAEPESEAHQPREGETISLPVRVKKEEISQIRVKKEDISQIRVKKEDISQIRVKKEDISEIRVKKEDISEVPLKIPRFQYVDFPSLHQCIQQLTVPPLQAYPLGRPSEPVNPKERPPKFKYVDFPSLHHCIKQLSVPPIESWSSGLARAERGSGERDGHGSGIPQPDSLRGNLSDNAVPTQKWEKYTAFPFPGPDPVSHQYVVSSHKPQQPPHPGSHSKANRIEGAPQNKMVASLSTTQSTEPVSCFSITKHEKGKLAVKTSSGVNDDGAESCQAKKPRHIHTQQSQDELGISLVQREEFWRTGPESVPESVCPFCQKMFTDGVEMRIHLKSHREKRPH